MKRILVLTEQYHPTPHATAICSERVLTALLHRHGIHADVLCFTSEHTPAEPTAPTMRILSVPRKKKRTSVGKIAAIEGLFCLPWFPLQTIARVRDALRYQSSVKSALKSGNYCAVIAAFHPYESGMALSAARKCAPRVRRLLWCLDPASYDDMERPAEKPLKELHRRLYFRREIKMFSEAEHILLMACSRTHYAHPRYDRFRTKFCMTDLPLLDLHTTETTDSAPSAEKSDPIRVLYAGRFYGAARNPQRYLTLLSLLPQDLSVRSDFYTDGSEDTALCKAAEQGFAVSAHPMIPHVLLQQTIRKADIHLSFGNRGQEIVPSKLFEALAEGKRILHFAKDAADSSLPYLDRYPAALVILDAEDDASAAKRLADFLRTPCYVEKAQLSELFSENTPAFTADLIASLLPAVP